MNNLDMIIVSSYDSAEHKNTDKEKLIIISFNSQLFSGHAVSNGMSSVASSFNILTW